MGLYINPTTQTGTHDKLQIIKQTPGVQETTFTPWSEHAPGADGKWGICVVDNGYFNAAGVAFVPRERETFVQDRSGRPRWFFFASLAAIKQLDSSVAEVLVKYHGAGE